MLKVRTNEERYVVEYKDGTEVLAKFFVKSIPMIEMKSILDSNREVEWDAPP